MPLSKRWLTHFFDRSDSHDIDYNRRLYFFLAFSYFGGLALSFFSYRNYTHDYKVMLFVVSATALVVFANLVLFHLYQCLTLCCKIASLGIITFCLVLVYQGGIDNTALYWVFPFPLILFAVLGYFSGALATPSYLGS